MTKVTCPQCYKKLRKKWAFKKCMCNKCGYEFVMGDYLTEKAKKRVLGL
jgi:ribosomal protein L37AE/L43A